MSEKTRGRRGSLERKPHFWFAAAASSAGDVAGDALRLVGDHGGGCAAAEGLGGRWKMCKVDLSDVTANMLELGDMDMLKMKAGSTPRRSSAMRTQLLVEKTRTRVPCSLAVARSCPSGLRSMARRGVLCAGMMVTFPDSSSTSCICPCDLPGKARSLEPRQHRPRGLSAVSKTEMREGGEEKA